MAPVILDSRESDPDFVALFIGMAKQRGFETIIDALPFGDIKYENIIIERKTINDFISSISSDRMWTQVANMKANPEYSSIIIVSGSYDDIWKGNRDKISHITGALKQLEAWGVVTIVTENDFNLIEHAFKLFEYAKPIDVPIKRVKKNDKLTLFMALPKTGYKNAKKLIEEFGTMEKLVEATEENIKKIVGPKKGSDIYKVLRE